MFRDSADEEIFFRSVLTLMLEGQKGISNLQKHARELVEEENAPHHQVEYWSRVLDTANHLSSSQFRSNYMNLVGATISLLGYRSNNYDAPYGH